MTVIKKISFITLIGALVMFSAFTINNAINWQIKDGYIIKFSGTGIEGEFEKINGNITFDENNLANSKMSVNVLVESISTGNWLKSKHAKSDDWFDEENFPKISFISSSFSKSGNGFIVNGFLEMHGVKKQITIPFTFQNNTFNGNFSVNRIDYGVGTLKGASKRISNEIKITISVPVTKIQNVN